MNRLSSFSGGCVRIGGRCLTDNSGIAHRTDRLDRLMEFLQWDFIMWCLWCFFQTYNITLRIITSLPQNSNFKLQSEFLNSRLPDWRPEHWDRWRTGPRKRPEQSIRKTPSRWADRSWRDPRSGPPDLQGEGREDSAPIPERKQALERICWAEEPDSGLESEREKKSWPESSSGTQPSEIFWFICGVF